MEIGIDLVFKIGAVGLISAVVNQLLNKAGKEELGMLVSLVGIVIAVLMVADKIRYLFDAVQTMFDL